MTADASLKPLIELMQREALQRGTFTLASGKTASYYLDCRRVTLHPKGAGMIGNAMLNFISRHSGADGVMPDAVGGMAIGADPITASIVTIAGGQDIDLHGFMVRKEAKGHGMGQQVEGPVEPGQNVVIVEDVITSGGSAIKAAEAAQAFGLNVLYVLAIIDRLAGGEEAFAAKGLKLHTLTTIRDFGIEPE
ncbi:orotate phosphoribosyltransferase [Rhodopirellula sp. SWK7]|uniref:orotate phosphoribosyltransferase n=1 Tax=Rhodopirellula sp. SWK7 TaxID=595460 RepID=UPI0002BE4480|nr:orotate phosphoribosyltransferase [Rhodopirellula sp. SWK7]EMI45085.1 orotate phosphoribosyltransferase [Rhodopirellula sp. SWK7]